MTLLDDQRSVLENLGRSEGVDTLGETSYFWTFYNPVNASNQKALGSKGTVQQT